MNDESFLEMIDGSDRLFYQLARAHKVGPDDLHDVVNMTKAYCWAKRHKYDASISKFNTWAGWQMRAVVKKYKHERFRALAAGVQFVPISLTMAAETVADHMTVPFQSAELMLDMGVPPIMVKMILGDELTEL